ncbi:hypothetical protein PAMP_012508 [Pampus punctatissimus]
MLRFSTQFTKMHLLLLMMMMMMMRAFIEMTAAQSPCDPITQYQLDGQCCKKCDPGTSMALNSPCNEPYCKECGEKEYRDDYTIENKCERQPYCDPNSNFQVAKHMSKTKRTICMCKVGYHFSSEARITCVLNRKCEPGQEVRSKGNQTHDTVCQNCPEGTFSDEASLDGVCKKWTECSNGYHIKERGTAISDNICEEISRTHLVVIGVVAALIGIVLTGLLIWRCRGTAKGKVKDCMELCMGREIEPLKEEALVTHPTPDHVCMVTEEHGRNTMAPEETEDESCQETLTGVLFTENGNLVGQENGKAEVLSRQESQTQMSSQLLLS